LRSWRTGEEATGVLPPVAKELALLAVRIGERRILERERMADAG